MTETKSIYGWVDYYVTTRWFKKLVLRERFYCGCKEQFESEQLAAHRFFILVTRLGFKCQITWGGKS